MKMKKSLFVLFLMCSLAGMVQAGGRFNLKKSIYSPLVEGNYVCTQVEDLNSIYSVTALLRGTGNIAQQVGQRFIERGRCEILSSRIDRAEIMALNASEDPSGINNSFMFAYSVWTDSHGLRQSGWAHVAAYPGYMKVDRLVAGMINKAHVSGTGSYLLDNTELK
ncbi:hypothetical protein ACI2KR_07940 [Pseudomonas luteola]